MILKIDHIGIAVADLEQSLKFYTEFLGMTVEKKETHAQQKVKVAFLPIGDTELELLESTDPEGAIAKFVKSRGEGIQHIAFRTDDIEKAVRELKGKGMHFVSEKPGIGAGNTKIIFLHPKDTHGVLIELVQPFF